jgi:hypothetical protein
MPQVSTVCRHPARNEIDATLCNGSASVRSLAARFSLTDMAIHRHKGRHLPAIAAKAHEAAEVARADDLLRQVKALQSKTLQTLLAAEKEGDRRTVLMAVREARSNIELLARLLGELEQAEPVNVEAVVAVVVQVVKRYVHDVDAREAVAAELSALLDGSSAAAG